METYTTLKAQYDRVFSKHRLRMVLNNEPFRAYMLEPEEGGRLNGVLIMFTPEGIVIMGDHSPVRTGICTNGYDQKWFSSKLNPEYLAGKFGLEQQWNAELAKEFVRDMLQEYTLTEEQREERLEMLETLQMEDMDQHAFYAQLQEWAVDEWYLIARGYDPNVMAKLTAIQHRFAQLMGDLEREEIKEPATQA
jgi:hypothetical protein